MTPEQNKEILRQRWQKYYAKNKQAINAKKAAARKAKAQLMRAPETQDIITTRARLPLFGTDNL